MVCLIFNEKVAHSKCLLTISILNVLEKKKEQEMATIFNHHKMRPYYWAFRM